MPDISALPHHRTILGVDVVSPGPASGVGRADLVDLIERSSFGTAAAQSLRRRTEPDVADSIVERLRRHGVVATSPAFAPTTGWLDGTRGATQHRAYARTVMYELLEQSLQASGITAAERDPLIDRGDGVLAMIHPVDTVPKTLLLSTLIPTLNQLLAEHANRNPHQALRMRAVVHAGEVHYDARGCFGEAIDLACRLLDASATKKALHETTSQLVLVVSDDIYRSVVRHGYHGIDRSEFTPLAQVRLGDRGHRGWIQRSARAFRPPGEARRHVPSSMPSVIVVHHDQTWRTAIGRRLIERGFDVVALTKNTSSAARIVRSWGSDTVLVDLDRAELSGDERASTATGGALGAKILILSSGGDHSDDIETATADASQVLVDVSKRPGA